MKSESDIKYMIGCHTECLEDICNEIKKLRMMGVSENDENFKSLKNQAFIRKSRLDTLKWVIG